MIIFKDKILDLTTIELEILCITYRCTPVLIPNFV